MLARELTHRTSKETHPSKLQVESENSAFFFFYLEELGVMLDDRDLEFQLNNVMCSTSRCADEFANNEKILRDIILIIIVMFFILMLYRYISISLIPYVPKQLDTNVLFRNKYLHFFFVSSYQNLIFTFSNFILSFWTFLFIFYQVSIL